MNDKFRNLLKTAIQTYPTQKEFAQASGLSNEHISRMLNQKYNAKPNMETLNKISVGSNGAVSLNDLCLACGYPATTINHNEHVLARLQKYAEATSNLSSSLILSQLKQNMMAMKRKIIYHSVYDFLLTLSTLTSENITFTMLDETVYTDNDKTFAEFYSEVEFYFNHKMLLSITIYYCKTQVKHFVLITDIDWK